jgi:hypothetical protein
MVGMTGFEPATSWSQTKRDTKLRYIPISDGEIPHLWVDQTIRSARLINLVGPVGLEPTYLSVMSRTLYQLSYAPMDGG